MHPGEQGQASAELAALLPVLAAVLAIAWQFALAGDASALAASAARAAARAAAVGGDPERAARTHLPSRLEVGLRVRRSPGGEVEVSVRVPAIVGAVALGRVEATAHLPAG